MKKDIFIDTNIAKNFSNPMDPEYKKLIRWLEYNGQPNEEDNAHLVVSYKLLGEYSRTCGHSLGTNNIIAIISQMTKDGRLVKIKNQQIKDFQKTHFTKKVGKKLLSNHEDRDHIPVVLLSDRQYALSRDDNLIHDLRNFPKSNVRVEKRPEKLPYDD